MNEAVSTPCNFSSVCYTGYMTNNIEEALAAQEWGCYTKNHSRLFRVLAAAYRAKEKENQTLLVRIKTLEGELSDMTEALEDLFEAEKFQGEDDVPMRNKMLALGEAMDDAKNALRKK